MHKSLESAGTIWEFLEGQRIAEGYTEGLLAQPTTVLCMCLTSHRLSDHYAFIKPNDRRALDLMNAAAVEVMKELPDLCIAYGVSDEYRFVLSFLYQWILPILFLIDNLALFSTQAVSFSRDEMRKSFMQFYPMHPLVYFVAN